MNESKIPSKALVVLSGGQDSTTCAFWAACYYDTVHCITFDYGQRHSIEIESAKKIASIIGAVSHEVVQLGNILKGTSPLTNQAEPLEQYQDAEQMAEVIGDRVEKTFVPMRNALFLTIAANHAICLGAYELVTGVCQEDNANYPDCREVFLRRQGAAINYALGHDLVPDRVGPWLWLRAPLMNLSKAETVQMAYEMTTQDPSNKAWPALAFTHTAYDGQYPPVGKDHATLLRASGFEQAGLPDPLVLRAVYERLMPLPDTSNYHNVKLNNKTIQLVQEMS